MSLHPMPVGGGWYELSDGERVQGHDEAKAAQAVLDAEERRDAEAGLGSIDTIVEREWSGHKQYSCTECHWDTLVQDDALAAAFRARDHALTHRE